MTTETAAPEVSKEKLFADLKVLIADTEELLRATAGQVGEKAAASLERMQASLSVLRTKLVDAERALLERTKQAARATDQYVHYHPWGAVRRASAP